VKTLHKFWQIVSKLCSLLLIVSNAEAVCPSAPGRYASSGAEVTDTSTGLIWARCSAGQVWGSGTCIGSVNTYTHEGALTYAKTQVATTGVAWRLPSVKELASIADRGCQNPAIDSIAFPTTSPSGSYWSSSPYLANTNYAWGVSSSHGGVGYGNRTDLNAVRLVRSPVDIGLGRSGVFDVAANNESGTPFNVPSGVSTCSFAATGSWRWYAGSDTTPLKALDQLTVSVFGSCPLHLRFR
jgi:Protein of unknown function (DUF1566)